MAEDKVPSKQDIIHAAERIDPFIHKTAVVTCKSINSVTGADIFFKCENFQKTGSFKFRGATNAVLSFSHEDAARGVATHSSGNHAQALALAAKSRNIKAYVVMPSNSSIVKVNAVKSYGADIIYCEPTLKSRELTLNRIIKDKGAIFIHPYNDLQIIKGQATAYLELIHEVPHLGVVLAPVGGGGLLSGTALSGYYFHRNAKVIGAEPENADDAYRSFKSGQLVSSGNPDTIADGLRTSLGDITFSLISKYVSDIYTVSEENIVLAMKYILERMKIVVEPSSAVPLGVVLEHKKIFQGQRVGIIISGGNVDLKKMAW